MNILIIEDDIILARNIKKAFLHWKFTNRTDHIASYEEFLKISWISYYDIIILDLCLWDSLPNVGMSILEHIRSTWYMIPVIIISSHSEYHFLEEAFSKWAHDYVIKPFRTRELQIRIRRWFMDYLFLEFFLKKEYISYGKIYYDVCANIFYYDGREIYLTKSHKYLLLLFILNKEKLLKKSFLVWKIWWDIDLRKWSVLRLKVLRLKKQLEKFGCSEYIRNIRWEWYMLKISD